MLTRALTLLTMLAPVALLHAAEETPTQKALKVIPHDALVFVTAPSMQALDTDLHYLISKLELEQMIPTNMVSIAGLIQEKLGITSGVDPSGSITLVLMKSQPDPESDEPSQAMYSPMHQIVLIATTDGNALLNSMGATPGEGGMWSVTMMDHPLTAMIKEKHVVFGDHRSAVRQFSEKSKFMSETLTSDQLQSFEGMDLCAWVDLQELITQYRPQIEGLMAMFSMQQMQGGDPAMAKLMERNQQQLKLVLDGSRAMSLGVSLAETGVGLRGTFASRPGTELSTMIGTLRSTDESLLKGLPGDSFVLSAGQLYSDQAAVEMVNSLTPFFDIIRSELKKSAEANQEDNEPNGETDAAQERLRNNEEKLAEMQNAFEQWVKLTRGYSASLSLLPDGSQGVFGICMILHTANAPQNITLIQQMVDSLKTFDVGDNLDAQEAQAAIAFKKDSETSEGVHIHQLMIDTEELGNMEDDEVEQLEAIVGKEGLLIRFAAIDQERLLISFGGGDDLMQKLIATAKENASPLANTKTVQAVDAYLPKKKYSALYASVNQIVRMVQRIQVALEEEPLPLVLPDVEAPVAASAACKQDWYQGDVYLPTDTLIVGKDIILTMLGRLYTPMTPGAEPTDGPDNDHGTSDSTQPTEE